MNELIQTIAVYALPVLFAITLHEAAHAYAAKFFGDTTAYSMGRMSLDPFKHIDLLGTIVLPVLAYALSFGSFLIGYAKPVPVNFGHLRKPKRDMAWVALAGPAANLVMAILWIAVLWLYLVLGLQAKFLLAVIQAGIKTNLVIMAFNLLPIPPLDGGRVLISVLPHRLSYQFAKLEPYGFFIVLGLMMLNLIYPYWMAPVMSATAMGISMLTPFSTGGFFRFLVAPIF
ncbi:MULTISPECIES: site-2 protease family protein [Herbaspirillum]|jgi:Zn-dependent protease|uniref:Site-2 protease family protein n=1 Tax=Herbaspirillum rubrisubalbicans Os34 TaxID=1235827 RepID=A0A6M3ZWA1_9BURK|nr:MULTISPECIES: site-2 protease family protein [Herbaspirillum]MCP1573713.1 Zn-dependent protease [Herbaspirillum rubrisubalbicans]QJQ02180.1 site-2 protease family protein [Herbaspirillum rubrisubalbicans Os34]